MGVGYKVGRIKRHNLRHRAYLECLSLHVNGLKQQAIADKLKLDQSTVSRILDQIHDESKDMSRYLTDEIPWSIRRSLLTFDDVQAKASQMFDATKDPRVKHLCLLLQLSVTSDRNNLLASLHGLNEAMATVKLVVEPLKQPPQLMTSSIEDDNKSDGDGDLS
jgi:hypothetical protein